MQARHRAQCLFYPHSVVFLHIFQMNRANFNLPSIFWSFAWQLNVPFLLSNPMRWLRT